MSAYFLDRVNRAGEFISDAIGAGDDPSTHPCSLILYHYRKTFTTCKGRARSELVEDTIDRSFAATADIGEPPNHRG
jgi:hypothetical protein